MPLPLDLQTKIEKFYSVLSKISDDTPEDEKDQIEDWLAMAMSISGTRSSLDTLPQASIDFFKTFENDDKHQALADVAKEIVSYANAQSIISNMNLSFNFESPLFPNAKLSSAIEQIQNDIKDNYALAISCVKENTKEQTILMEAMKFVDDCDPLSRSARPVNKGQAIYEKLCKLGMSTIENFRSSFERFLSCCKEYIIENCLIDINRELTNVNSNQSAVADFKAYIRKIVDSRAYLQIAQENKDMDPIYALQVAYADHKDIRKLITTILTISDPTTLAIDDSKTKKRKAKKMSTDENDSSEEYSSEEDSEEDAEENSENNSDTESVTGGKGEIINGGKEETKKEEGIKAVTSHQSIDLKDMFADRIKVFQSIILDQNKRQKLEIPPSNSNKPDDKSEDEDNSQTSSPRSPGRS